MGPSSTEPFVTSACVFDVDKRLADEQAKGKDTIEGSKVCPFSVSMTFASSAVPPSEFGVPQVEPQKYHVPKDSTTTRHSEFPTFVEFEQSIAGAVVLLGKVCVHVGGVPV